MRARDREIVNEMMRSSKYLCGHCDQRISKTLYYEHKKIFYSQETRAWRKVLRTENTRGRVQSANASAQQEDFIIDNYTTGSQEQPCEFNYCIV